MALEIFLYHFRTCCGYSACSLWSKEHTQNNFECISLTKITFGNKMRRDASFWHLKQYFLVYFYYHEARYRVITNYQKLASLRILFPKFIFVGDIHSKLFFLCFLDPRKHAEYPQHVLKWYRKISKAICRIWSKFNEN